jgi:RNA polymerase sigma factor for flagellar operon FliA
MTDASGSSQTLFDQGQALIRSLALKIAHTSGVQIDLEDLIAYGQIGLAEAARDYQPGRGSQFTSYAYYRIRGAMYDGLSKMTGNSRARCRQMRRQQLAEEVLREINETPDLAVDGTVDREIRWFRRITERLAVVYFSSLGEGQDDWEDERFADNAAPPPVQIASREIAEKLCQMIERLPSGERQLIRKVYFEGATLQEAAADLGISKSWASRLHAKTLSQLASMLRQVGVREAI